MNKGINCSIYSYGLARDPAGEVPDLKGGFLSVEILVNSAIQSHTTGHMTLRAMRNNVEWDGQAINWTGNTTVRPVLTVRDDSDPNATNITLEIDFYDNSGAHLSSDEFFIEFPPAETPMYIDYKAKFVEIYGNRIGKDETTLNKLLIQGTDILPVLQQTEELAVTMTRSLQKTPVAFNFNTTPATRNAIEDMSARFYKIQGIGLAMLAIKIKVNKNHQFDKNERISIGKITECLPMTARAFATHSRHATSAYMTEAGDITLSAQESFKGDYVIYINDIWPY